MVDGRVVLPAGREFSGTVAQAVQAGKLAGGATLRIALNSFSFQGKEYHVQAPPVGTAKVTGGGAVIGAVIGALAGKGKGALDIKSVIGRCGSNCACTRSGGGSDQVRGPWESHSTEMR